MIDSDKWETFEELRGDNEERHCCRSNRIASLRGICVACILDDFFEELDETITEKEKENA